MSRVFQPLLFLIARSADQMPDSLRRRPNSVIAEPQQLQSRAALTGRLSYFTMRGRSIGIDLKIILTPVLSIRTET